MGHSVSVLKLVILFARVLGALSPPSSSSATDPGLGENAGYKVSANTLGGYSCSRGVSRHCRICVERILDDCGHVLIHFKHKIKERLNLVYNDRFVVSMQVNHDL